MPASVQGLIEAINILEGIRGEERCDDLLNLLRRELWELLRDEPKPLPEHYADTLDRLSLIPKLRQPPVGELVLPIGLKAIKKYTDKKGA